MPFAEAHLACISIYFVVQDRTSCSGREKRRGHAQTIALVLQAAVKARPMGAQHTAKKGAKKIAKKIAKKAAKKATKKASKKTAKK